MHSDTSGTEPPQPLFELTPLTAEQAEAYSGLLDYGCQVVLCSSKKSPTWIGWQKKTPTYDDLWHHDGPIALIPASRHLVVFDCDSGTPDDIAAFAREYPPIVQPPSRQPGRWHFFYPATRLIKNSWFGWRSVSGDVRSQAGYVVLWRDNARRLLEALMDPNPTSTQAPLHLIQKTPPQTRAKPAPQRTSTSDPEPPRRRSGSPGPIHFDQLRNWAYRTPRGTDREAWGLRVADESRRLNEDLPVPLTLAEVEYTAAAVAEWVWNKMPGEYLAKGGEWTTDLARQMGLASGDRRQLVLLVTTTIFAGRDGVIIRYGGTVDYRPTSQAIEAETYGRQDTGNGSGQGWDERAFSAQVAEWAIAVAGETGASVAHSAGSLRRGVGG